MSDTARYVELFVLYLIGKILLIYPVIREIMRVFISDGLRDVSLSVRMDIFQMSRHRSLHPGHIVKRSSNGFVGCIAFFVWVKRLPQSCYFLRFPLTGFFWG